MTYTLESLKEVNQSKHCINESVVNCINALVQEIENDRNNNAPTYGDIVKYTNKYGEFYPHASVQPANGFTKENEINICQSGSHGFYTSHHISTSGGPWCNVDKSHFKLIGKATASFWTWGDMGACTNGGVDFTADVNLWECNINEQKYSTEFYNKQYIYDHGKIDESGYRWFGQNIAFKTLNDYKAWLKTFNGIEKLQEESNQFIVWFDKNHDHYVSLDIYNSIKNYLLDTTLCNGVRECKRVYGKENHRVDTYVTYDIPALDWKRNGEYARVRKLLKERNE